MNKRQITIASTASESTVLSDFIRAYIDTNNLPADIIDDLRLVTEEAFINITMYAFTPDEVQDVNIEIEHTTDSLDITFTDAGREFNPLCHCIKSIDATDLCEGGMGIPLIKSLTDEQRYKRVGQHNVFTLTKHYTKRN